jgi:L-ascorbate metabolism protein UlaG (beta-lactamase superfamily)
MVNLTIQLLGIGAVKLSDGEKVIYVDAFTKPEYVKPHPVDRVDLILLTHDDADHFGCQETAQVALDSGAMVVGPPSIAYPLLAEANLPPEQLKIIYPPHFKQPLIKTVNGFKLKVYQTTHFVDWEPPHLSFLLEFGGKRLYIAGDTYMMDEEDLDLQNLDVVLYSLVFKDMLAPTIMDDHLEKLTTVQSKFGPRYLLPSHLVTCDWTIDPTTLKNEVERRGYENIVVLDDAEQVFELA